MSNAEQQEVPVDQTPPHAIERLRLAHELRDYHHKALWEEEKHFTWFLSILMSSDVLIATTDKLKPDFKEVSTALLSVLGVAISLLALRVVCNESSHFEVALNCFKARYSEVFPDFPLLQARPREGKMSLRRLLSLVALSGIKTRIAFQCIFGLFFSVFGFVLCILIWCGLYR